jgi:hypothetical protein
LPDNTHLKFDFIAALPVINRFYNMPEFSGWWWPQVTTYLSRRCLPTMAQDEEREQEALEWSEATIVDVSDEAR